MLVPEAPKEAARGRPASRGVLAVAALFAAALSTSWLRPSFVPPPVAPNAPMAKEDTTLWDGLQECVEDGLDGAMTAAEDFFSSADELIGPSLNPQLLPAGSVPAPKEEGLSHIIEPLTKLYMRYRTAIFPRCKECKIIVRFGRLWRTCRIRRHKARQPGITTFKKRMNKYQGWKQSTFRR
mmetsp:Transcript_4085/g.7446  ORF Transcript_4085/g.7446 Transcript_4085/m.7446 type:complete len:181 (-) Transcript_4085:129-671(-)